MSTPGPPTPASRTFQVPPEDAATEGEEAKTLPRLVTTATEDGNAPVGPASITTEDPTGSESSSGSSLERVEFWSKRKEIRDGIRPSLVIVTFPPLDIPTERRSRDRICET